MDITRMLLITFSIVCLNVSYAGNVQQSKLSETSKMQINLGGGYLVQAASDSVLKSTHTICYYVGKAHGALEAAFMSELVLNKYQVTAKMNELNIIVSELDDLAVCSLDQELSLTKEEIQTFKNSLKSTLQSIDSLFL